MSFVEIVENLDYLSYEESLKLSEILNNKIRDNKHYGIENQLDYELKVAENEFNLGNYKSGSAEDLISELERELSIE